MRPRLFLGNFDFEHRLAEPSREPSYQLQRLNAELACAWLAIAEDGDYLWTPSAFDDDFLGSIESAALPKTICLTSLHDVPTDVECVPWGWSAEIRQLVERFGWHTEMPDYEVVRLANSRSLSEKLEQLWNVGLPGGKRIESIVEFQQAIQSLGRSDDRWVVKAEFGMSARERILGRGNAKPADENWVRRRLALDGAVFFEPWVERLDEIGVQIEIPREGQPRIIGLTPMIVDPRGQYAGSWFKVDESWYEADRSLWSIVAETALCAAVYLQSSGYFGPLGIDSMIYRDRDGSHRIRPLQDINARWTMGRLSLGWRRLLALDEQGVWQHGTSLDLAPTTSLDLAPTQGKEIRREITTSPTTVGGIRSQRASRILIQSMGQLTGDSQSGSARG